jgi:hypothetical protein
MMRHVLILCAAFALTCCATEPGTSILMHDAPATAAAAAPKPVCPPFRAWSDADLKALGEALAPIPEVSIVMRMALDWRRYYGDAKACAAK